ncbi:hypothetical protein EDD22DRAFT_968582 [Suillus occidentalis]|nr:hypothetical protein EDD22DRAFT_968582 [Suillus occidentalis]
MSLAALDALENLPTEFIEPLHISQRQNIVDSFARLDFLTEGTKQPKLFQLKCLMSLLASRHVVVRVATGAGKTLAMILSSLAALSQQDCNHRHTIEAFAKRSCQRVCPVWHSLRRNQP